MRVNGKEREEIGRGEVEVDQTLDILGPDLPVTARFRQDQGGAVELQGRVRVAGQGGGEVGAEAVGEAVFRGPGLKVIGQASEEAEVGLRAGLEGEREDCEEKHRCEGGEGG